MFLRNGDYLDQMEMQSFPGQLNVQAKSRQSKLKRSRGVLEEKQELLWRGPQRYFYSVN